jgi:hypothetical protein
LNTAWEAKKLWKEPNLQEKTLKTKLGARRHFLRHDGFRNRDWYRWTFCVEPSRKVTFYYTLEGPTEATRKGNIYEKGTEHTVKIHKD